MPHGLRQVLTPRVKSVSAKKKPVNTGSVVQEGSDAIGQPRHLLVVVENGNPFAMLMRVDSFKAFEHLIALNDQSSAPGMDVRQDGAPDRMGVENCPGLADIGDAKM